MSCLVAILGLFLFIFGFVVFGLQQLCTFFLYLLDMAVGALFPFL